MNYWLEEKIDRLSGTPEFETERVLLEITEAIADRLETSGIKRSQLARRMGVDRAVVTRLLSGDQNMTVRTLVSTGLALGCRLEINLEPRQTEASQQTLPGFATGKTSTRVEQPAVTSADTWEPVAIQKQIAELKARMKTYQVRGGKELDVHGTSTAA